MWISVINSLFSLHLTVFLIWMHVFQNPESTPSLCIRSQMEELKNFTVIGVRFSFVYESHFSEEIFDLLFITQFSLRHHFMRYFVKNVWVFLFSHFCLDCLPSLNVWPFMPSLTGICYFRGPRHICWISQRTRCTYYISIGRGATKQPWQAEPRQVKNYKSIWGSNSLLFARSNE